VPHVIFAAANQEISSPAAVGTFECLGLYYSSPFQGECQVRYRPVNTSDWRQAFPLWYDDQESQYRGSLAGLEPDTIYDIELQAGGTTVPFRGQTRSDNFPVGKVTTLDSGTLHTRIEITESGKPGGYHLIQPPEGERTSIDALNLTDYNIVVDADYVIIRGLELKNAAIHGILIREGRHDVVVEECRITFWGRIGGPRSFGNLKGGTDSAINAESGVARLTAQRNLIEHPRGATNDWRTGHPSGPQGISLWESAGGHVIRYNEIWSSEDHGYNDIIGGGSNFSRVGNLNKDSDVYGNILRNAWDDAIESEGANMNVRIWGNYMEKYYQAIAVAGTSRGPIYIYRNICGESRRHHDDPMGGNLIKTSGRDGFQHGQKYIFHNTVLQPGGPHDIIPSSDTRNVMSRNNIFDCPGRLAPDWEGDAGNDFDYDMFNGRARGGAQEEHGTTIGSRGHAAFTSSSRYRLEFYPASTTTEVQYMKYETKVDGTTIRITDPMLTVPNPVIDNGQVLPGFNDNYSGAAPDMGAFETGRPPLEFGRRAYLGHREGWAPWERF